jgi:hypothetical protein
MVADHEVFGKSLRAFQLRRFSRGAEAFKAGFRETINDAQYERNFRAYDGQIDGLMLSKFQ